MIPLLEAAGHRYVAPDLPIASDHADFTTRIVAPQSVVREVEPNAWT